MNIGNKQILFEFKREIHGRIHFAKSSLYFNVGENHRTIIIIIIILRVNDTT